MHSKKKVYKEDVDLNEPKLNLRQIKKEIAFLASSSMTWKERKDIENRKVVSLGGKPQKQQRRPLSVARPIIKKQKEREEKMRAEQLLLGELNHTISGSSRRPVTKRKSDGTVLKPTEGYFRHGVLDVKHLLRPAPATDTDHRAVKGKKKGATKKNQAKNKGGNRNRH